MPVNADIFQPNSRKSVQCEPGCCLRTDGRTRRNHQSHLAIPVRNTTQSPLHTL